MKVPIFFAMMSMSCAAHAQDIFVIGEVHDNPAHHAEQAKRVLDVMPTALVFEMLTSHQAAQVTDAIRTDAEALKAALNWDQSGWPDFAMYYPIFAAAPDAAVFGGGVGREEARAAMRGGFEDLMAGDAHTYGLDQPLPDFQQVQREALQMAAHCDALPEDMLPGMVRIQRLRDAILARATVEAYRKTGGPVVVITGNGHARKDWGMPAALILAAPELEVFAIGQTEDERPLEGVFDEVVSAVPPERGDPCAAFR